MSKQRYRLFYHDDAYEAMGEVTLAYVYDDLERFRVDNSYIYAGVQYEGEFIAYLRETYPVIFKEVSPSREIWAEPIVIMGKAIPEELKGGKE